MTFNIAPRESISRCELYANKFQTHTTEIEARLKALRIQHANLDVHESESARLERQMMQRFTKGFILQEGSNLEFIKKVGKFIFVAVLLPPYFAVYLAPKWVFQYAMPFVADMGQTGFMRLYHIAVTAANWLAQISGQLLERFNRLFQFRLSFPFNVGKSSQDMLHRLSSLFKKISAPFAHIKRTLEEETTKHRKKLKALWENLIQSLLKVKKALTPSFSLGLPQLPKLPSIPKFSLSPFKEKVLHARNLFKSFKKIPIAIGLFLWDIVLLNYQNWIEPYIQWILPFARWAKSKANQLIIKIQAKISIVKNQIQKIQKWLKVKLQIVCEKIVTCVTPIRSTFNKVRNLLQSASLRCQNGILIIKEQLLEQRKQLQRYLQHQKQKAKKFALNLLTAFLQTPQKLLTLLNRLTNLLFAFFTELFKAFRLAFIVVKVLLKLGFNYLRSNF